MKQKTLSQHLSEASKARHAKKTPEQRSAYAKMMVTKREEKRAVRRLVQYALEHPEFLDPPTVSDIKDT